MQRKANKIVSLISRVGIGLGMASLATADAPAQTYSVLVEFAGTNGANPYASLVPAGSALYGTAASGGISNYGTVFRVNTDGTGFTNLYNFTGGGDGSGPEAGLALSESSLYGTTFYGGSSGYGTIFRINTDGTGFTNLYSFTDSARIEPYAGLVLSGGNLYGTTYSGGSYFNGTVFRIDTNGTGFTTVHSFTYNDGAIPYAGLIFSGGTLYGATYYGGSYGQGAVFKVNTDGSEFTTLYNFTGRSDGANPEAGLVLSGSTVYGTTLFGGSSSNGTVYRLDIDGTGFTNLYTFPGSHGINPHGANPFAGLALSGSTLYGTTRSGGGYGFGTVYQLNTDGTGFTNLHSFAIAIYPYYTNSDGSYPYAGLLSWGSALYGTASAGGTSGYGTVFKLALAPPLLRVQAAANRVELNWDGPGFSLQTAPEAGGIYTNIPGATSPYTIVATRSQAFFRLQSN